MGRGDVAASKGQAMARKMCKIAEKGKLKKTAELARDPKFICAKCCRVAADKQHLCKPRKL